MARNITLDITVPRGWHDLTQDQLRYLLTAITKAQASVGADAAAPVASEALVAKIAAMCIFEWGGLRMICKYGDDGWLVAHGEDEMVITTGQVAAATTHLSWIRTVPDHPLRLDTIDGADAPAADLSDDFSFDRWLSCEALWQGFLTTTDSSCLTRMAAVLYAKPDISLTPAETLSIFYWWASVKIMVSQMFPNFFQCGSDGETPTPPSRDELRRSMDAQIRALTKGDVTKEPQILQMPALRALTELDAQAREYEELNRKYPRK